MSDQDAIRANPDEEPYEGLFVILNERRISCKKCGHVHKFITFECKPIAVRSDDGKAIALYGAHGALLPIDQSGIDVNVTELEIRDNRLDEDEVVDSPTDIGVWDPASEETDGE